MKILLLGAPGSGKGTQAKFISEYFNIPHISTGDMLRQERDSGTDRGELIKSLIDNGKFVSDEIIIPIIQDRIAQPDCVNGFILDGYPRSIEQAHKINSIGVNLDFVVEIDVPFELIVERITGRLIHEASGRSYHIKFAPPKVAGLDDVTGEKLIQRPDDTVEVIQPRLNTYQDKTMPVIEFYKAENSKGNCKYVHILGVGEISEITDKIVNSLK